jgi:hypothetical protein
MAKFNFKQTAQEQTTLSPLMKDREQKTTEQIIAKFPDGFTVNEFDIARLVDTKTGELNEFAIVTIHEDDEAFFYGGNILTKICKEWAIAFDGDMDEANKELAKAGGVQMKMEPGKTKNGNNLTRVIIL